jgi:hypothetical protein
MDTLATAEDQGRAVPAARRDPRREERGGEQAGDVERGGEERQQLAVEPAVVAGERGSDVVAEDGAAHGRRDAGRTPPRTEHGRHHPRPRAAAVLDRLLGASAARACSIRSKSELTFLDLGWRWEMTATGGSHLAGREEAD